MPKLIKNRPRDLNERATSIVAEITDEDWIWIESVESTDEGKNPHAVALGRLGGKKGGNARAKALTPEQRQEIARAAAIARWKKKD